MTLEQLREAVAGGSIDTVLLTICDMQGRLQGKRLTGRYFLDETVENRAEGCDYLLAVDVDMETVGGYRMTSWESGYGACSSPTSTRCAPSRGSRRPRCAWPTCAGTTAPTSPPRRGRSSVTSSTASPSAAGRPRWAPSSSSCSFATPTRRPGSAATATSSRPTSTTSTTRSSGPRAWSR